MASYNKFNTFTLDLGTEKHNFSADTLKVALTNSAPVATNTVLANITEVSYANCSSRNLTIASWTQATGTAKLVINDLTLTATGTVGPFRYVVIYNDTAPNDELIAWFDRAASITLESGDTLPLDFDASAGLLTIA
jgi:hypothetical protein